MVVLYTCFLKRKSLLNTFNPVWIMIIIIIIYAGHYFKYYPCIISLNDNPPSLQFPIWQSPAPMWLCKFKLLKLKIILSITLIIFQALKGHMSLVTTILKNTQTISAVNLLHSTALRYLCVITHLWVIKEERKQRKMKEFAKGHMLEGRNHGFLIPLHCGKCS